MNHSKFNCSEKFSFDKIWYASVKTLKKDCSFVYLSMFWMGYMWITHYLWLWHTIKHFTQYLSFGQFLCSCYKWTNNHPHTASTDLPDPFSPLVSIIHRSREVFQATSSIGTELLYIAGRPTFALPFEEVHSCTSLMSSCLLLRQHTTFKCQLVNLTFVDSFALLTQLKCYLPLRG